MLRTFFILLFLLISSSPLHSMDHVRNFIHESLIKESPLVECLRKMLPERTNNKISKESLSSIESLLNQHADVHAKSRFGSSCLHIACAFKDPALAALLIEHGAKVDVVFEDNKISSLGQHLNFVLPASLHSTGDTIKHILQTRIGCTPLHIAAIHGNVAVMKLLIEKGAHVNAAAQDGRRPLYPIHCAVASGNVDAFLLLKNNGAYDFCDPSRNELIAIAYQQAYREAINAVPLMSSLLTMPIPQFVSWVFQSRWSRLFLCLWAPYVLKGVEPFSGPLESMIIKREQVSYELIREIKLI